MKLDDAITEIGRARRRLEDDQGRLARKNARAALKAAVATILRAMDREYPLIRKERVARVAMTPLAKKRRERRRRMQFATVLQNHLGPFVACGVKITPNGDTSWRVPRWAFDALRGGIPASTIREAVRSPAARKQIAALLRLKSQAPQP